MISRLFIGGYSELEQYRQEILDGILDFEIEREWWEYTYHSRIAEQLPFIYRELKRNLTPAERLLMYATGSMIPGREIPHPLPPAYPVLCSG